VHSRQRVKNWAKAHITNFNISCCVGYAIVCNTGSEIKTMRHEQKEHPSLPANGRYTLSGWLSSLSLLSVSSGLTSICSAPSVLVSWGSCSGAGCFSSFSSSFGGISWEAYNAIQFRLNGIRFCVQPINIKTDIKMHTFDRLSHAQVSRYFYRRSNKHRTVLGNWVSFCAKTLRSFFPVRE